MATISMTRKEAVAKCHGIAYPEAFVQALEALGLLHVREEITVIDVNQPGVVMIKRNGKTVYED